MTHLRTGTPVFLPHLAAATELLVIDLVAQHDPQTDPELASCSTLAFSKVRRSRSSVEGIQIDGNGFLLVALAATPHPADRTSACVAPLCESPTDGLPDDRSLVFPSAPETSASIL
jgi:hypothetical protein